MHILPQPARYWPFMHGRYDVLPRLAGLGRDFGNGSVDALPFQFDDRFPQFQAAKHAARREQPARHVLVSPIDPHVERSVAHIMLYHLANDWPDLVMAKSMDGETLYRFTLTGDVIATTDAGWEMERSTIHADPPPISLLDAIALQIQEDFAIVHRTGGSHTIPAMHICLPAHWRPETKVGRTFAEIHAIVPGMEPFNNRQDVFIDQMINAKEGLVRFTWGLQPGDGLNGHPDGGGVLSDKSDTYENWFLRVERQVILGVPSAHASIFLIRTYLTPMVQIKAMDEEGHALADALQSMDDASVCYKGLTGHRDALADWLRV